mgnify:CR=1 FL=1
MIKLNFNIFFLILTSVLVSCSDNENYVPIENSVINIPEEPFDYINLNLPSHFINDMPGQPLPTSINGLDNTPNDNAITNEGATLGRVLFYDKSLSANKTIACASCHKQDKGFSDEAILSVGFDGGLTGRHSMTLINSRFYQRGRFFWDERATTLEEQVLEPFQDPVEMGMTLEQVVSAVQGQDFYPELFENAFGTQEINSDRISTFFV